MNVYITVFLGAMQCSFVGTYQHFGGHFWLLRPLTRRHTPGAQNLVTFTALNRSVLLPKNVFASISTIWQGDARYYILRALNIFSLILLTRLAINGCSGLINRFIGQSRVATSNTYNTSKGYWNNNTQSLQHFHT
jgi:hypothetical protein